MEGLQAELTKHTVVLLRAELKARGLITSGVKLDLIGRLAPHVQRERAEAAEAAAAAAEQKLHSTIAVRIKSQMAGGDSVFNLKMTDTMATAFGSYAECRGVARGSLVFMFDGVRCSWDATPLDLDLEDEDQIDCFRVQPTAAAEPAPAPAPPSPPQPAGAAPKPPPKKVFAVSAPGAVSQHAPAAQSSRRPGAAFSRLANCLTGVLLFHCLGRHAVCKLDSVGKAAPELARLCSAFPELSWPSTAHLVEHNAFVRAPHARRHLPAVALLPAGLLRAPKEGEGGEDEDRRFLCRTAAAELAAFLLASCSGGTGGARGAAARAGGFALAVALLATELQTEMGGAGLGLSACVVQLVALAVCVCWLGVLCWQLAVTEPIGRSQSRGCGEGSPVPASASTPVPASEPPAPRALAASVVALTPAEQGAVRTVGGLLALGLPTALMGRSGLCKVRNPTPPPPLKGLRAAPKPTLTERGIPFFFAAVACC